MCCPRARTAGWASLRQWQPSAPIQMLQLLPSLSFASVPPRHIYSENKPPFFYDQTHIAGLVERSISFCLMKHEWKAMGRVIYGSRKTAFFEEKKANFAARLNCTGGSGSGMILVIPKESAGHGHYLVGDCTMGSFIERERKLLLSFL